MKAMTPTAADIQFRTRMPAAAGPEVIAISDHLMLAMQSPGAGDMRNGADQVFRENEWTGLSTPQPPRSCVRC